MARKSGSSSVTPIILLILGSIIILLVVIWQTIRVLDRPPTPTQPTATPVSFLPYPDVPRISIADARAALDANSAVLIDVRGDADYARSHIPGALDITYTDLQSHMNDFKKDQELILYCA